MDEPSLEVTADEVASELLAMLSARDQEIATLRAALKQELRRRAPQGPASS